MCLYKARYKSIFRAIVPALVCLCLANDVGWATFCEHSSRLETSVATLAPQSRLAPFLEKLGLDLKNRFITIAAAIELKKLIIDRRMERAIDVAIKRAIIKFNRKFTDAAVIIDDAVRIRKFKCSEKEYRYLVFKFRTKDGMVPVEAAFIEDYVRLAPNEQAELGINNDIDRSSLDCKGLEGVWFINPAAETKQRSTAGASLAQQPALEPHPKTSSRRAYTLSRRHATRLESIFREIFTELKGGPVILKRAQALFTGRESEIYRVMAKYKKAQADIMAANGHRNFYLMLTRLDTPDCGICDDVVNMMMTAARDSGFVSPDELGKEEISISPDFMPLVHYYFTLRGHEGKIAVDLCTGQFIPENIARCVVKPDVQYSPRIRSQLGMIYQNNVLEYPDNSIRGGSRRGIETDFHSARHAHEPPTPVRVAFFDWDGTIADTARFTTMAFSETYKIMMPDGTAEEGAAYYFELDGLNTDQQYDKLRDLAAKRGVALKLDRAQYKELFIGTKSRLEGDLVELIPGAVEFLKRLKRSGVKLHIVSGMAYDILIKKVGLAGLSDLFEGIYGSASTEEQRRAFAPSKSAYMKMTLAAYGVNPASAVMFGDTKQDMSAAREAGVAGIGRAETGAKEAELKEAKARFTIKDYTSEDLEERVKSAVSVSISAPQAAGEVDSRIEMKGDGGDVPEEYWIDKRDGVVQGAVVLDRKTINVPDGEENVSEAYSGITRFIGLHPEILNDPLTNIEEVVVELMFNIAGHGSGGTIELALKREAISGATVLEVIGQDRGRGLPCRNERELTDLLARSVIAGRENHVRGRGFALIVLMPSTCVIEFGGKAYPFDPAKASFAAPTPSDIASGTRITQRFVLDDGPKPLIGQAGGINDMQETSMRPGRAFSSDTSPKPKPPVDAAIALHNAYLDRFSGDSNGAYIKKPSAVLLPAAYSGTNADFRMDLSTSLFRGLIDAQKLFEFNAVEINGQNAHAGKIANCRQTDVVFMAAESELDVMGSLYAWRCDMAAGKVAIAGVPYLFLYHLNSAQKNTDFYVFVNWLLERSSSPESFECHILANRQLDEPDHNEHFRDKRMTLAQAMDRLKAEHKSISVKYIPRANNVACMTVSRHGVAILETDDAKAVNDDLEINWRASNPIVHPFNKPCHVMDKSAFPADFKGWYDKSVVGLAEQANRSRDAVETKKIKLARDAEFYRNRGFGSLRGFTCSDLTDEMLAGCLVIGRYETVDNRNFIEFNKDVLVEILRRERGTYILARYIVEYCKARKMLKGSYHNNEFGVSMLNLLDKAIELCRDDIKATILLTIREDFIKEHNVNEALLRKTFPKFWQGAPGTVPNDERPVEIENPPAAPRAERGGVQGAAGAVEPGEDNLVANAADLIGIAVSASLQYRVPILITPSQGCSNQCIYCGRGAHPRVKNMSWRELVAVVNVISGYRDTLKDFPPFVNWFDSDPLREYHDQAYGKDYGDVLRLLFENKIIFNRVLSTSGWDIAPAGDAARSALAKIAALDREHDLGIRIVFHLNKESARYKRLGYEQYVKNMKAAYMLAVEYFGDRVDYDYGATDGFDLKMLEEITGRDIKAEIMYPTTAQRFFKPSRRGKALRLSQDKTIPQNPDTFVPANYIVIRPGNVLERYEEELVDGKVITKVTPISANQAAVAANPSLARHKVERIVPPTQDVSTDSESAKADLSFEAQRAKEEADRIHNESLHYYYPEKFVPGFTDKTLICHIITDSIVPVEQQQMLKSAVETEIRLRAEKGEKFQERVVCLSGKNMRDPKEFMKDLQIIMAEKLKEYQALGYTDVRFDVACPDIELGKDTKLIDEVLGSSLKIKGLAFKPTVEGVDTITQVEGIIMALRALNTEDFDKLKAAFVSLAHRPLSDDELTIQDLDTFIRRIPFILPATKMEDLNERKRINDLIATNIKEAA